MSTFNTRDLALEHAAEVGGYDESSVVTYQVDNGGYGWRLRGQPETVLAILPVADVAGDLAPLLANTVHFPEGWSEIGAGTDEALPASMTVMGGFDGTNDVTSLVQGFEVDGISAPVVLADDAIASQCDAILTENTAAMLTPVTLPVVNPDHVASITPAEARQMVSDAVNAAIETLGATSPAGMPGQVIAQFGGALGESLMRQQCETLARKMGAVFILRDAVTYAVIDDGEVTPAAKRATGAGKVASVREAPACHPSAGVLLPDLIANPENATIVRNALVKIDAARAASDRSVLDGYIGKKTTSTYYQYLREYCTFHLPAVIAGAEARKQQMTDFLAWQAAQVAA